MALRIQGCAPLGATTSKRLLARALVTATKGYESETRATRRDKPSETCIASMGQV